jgi:hypothetical protein
MQLQQLRTYVHAHPDRPFTLHVADGRTIDVKHSDYIAIPEKGRTIVVIHDNNTHDMLEVALITGVHGEGEHVQDDAAE